MTPNDGSEAQITAANKSVAPRRDPDARISPAGDRDLARDLLDLALERLVHWKPSMRRDFRRYGRPATGQASAEPSPGRSAMARSGIGNADLGLAERAAIRTRESSPATRFPAGALRHMRVDLPASFVCSRTIGRPRPASSGRPAVPARRRRANSNGADCPGAEAQDLGPSRAADRRSAALFFGIATDLSVQESRLRPHGRKGGGEGGI